MEFDNIVKNFLDKEKKLKLYPSKKKNKIAALAYLTTKFEKGVIYTEKEVNEILDKAHTFNDRCLLRRDLYDHKFLGRERNGSRYWVEENQPSLEDFKLD